MTAAGSIFASRNDRMGGRLGAILNAKRIADDYGIRFRFAWSDHDNVSPELRHPETLFSAGFLEQYREFERGYGDIQQNTVLVDNMSGTIDRDGFLQMVASGTDLRSNESMRAVALPWETWHEIGARVAATLDTVEFVPEVTEAMARIRDRLGNAELVAYHLRRGDIINPNSRASNVLWPSKYVPRVFYEEHIARMLRETSARIVIFSDSDHEVRAFSRLSDRVIPASDLVVDSGLTELQRDFLQMYAMSRCSQIIAPGASAFSSVAAILGNSRVVDITTDLTDAERESALNRLTTRLRETPDDFSSSADLGQNFPELIAFHERQGTPEVARDILRQHLDDGFALPYIYDLLAEEYFKANDADAAIGIVDLLRGRPILADLANSPAYVWAGFAALAANRPQVAARLAHVGHWLQPILPLSRILISELEAAGHISGNNHYPVAPEFVTYRPAVIARFNQISTRLHPQPDGADNSQPQLNFIPFEIEVRDWARLQSTRLPAQFNNIANLKKIIGFFHSAFRRTLDQPQTRSFLGQLHIQAEEPDVGIPMIESALVDAPEDPFVQIRFARLEMQRDNPPKALAAYEKAADLSGSQICFRAEFGLELLKQEEKQKAAEIFTELAGIKHHMVELHILTADVLRRRVATRELALSVAAYADALVPGGLRTSQVYRKVLEQLDRQYEADYIRDRFLLWQRTPGRFTSRINV
ncbi:hypothetical protein [Paracoccus pacificus]|uniref:Uncharacterized protein n=1 Tax=Paracoccus pacificus TaxID=1463598 RepID=A0ABW4R329_9RHOB